MLAALMVEIGVKRCAIDSSGNAATTVAAYAARAGSPRKSSSRLRPALKTDPDRSAWREDPCH